MADEALVSELLNQIIDDVLHNGLLDDPTWQAYGLAAEVMDDSSTVQAAYTYLDDGSAASAKGVKQSFTLHELREASRGDDGSTWQVFVLKIHRPSGQAAGQFVLPGHDGEWSLQPDNDARLTDLLRSRPEDFDEPI